MIVFIGLPGSGKTSVGRHLATRLNVPFYDTDQIIEERVGLPIPEFFAAFGEQKFRDVEESVVSELVQNPSAMVLSTGGGAVLSAKNRTSFSAGQVVYLHARPEQIFYRLRNNFTRPLLRVADPCAKLNRLYIDRDPLYREIAHFVIETGRPSVAALANLVMMQLELGH